MKTAAVMPRLSERTFGASNNIWKTLVQSQLEISTNVYIVGYSSATIYYGDGSNLTGIAEGDVLLASTQTFTGQTTVQNQVTISSGATISGNVGIGTTSQISTLDADGAIVLNKS